MVVDTINSGEKVVVDVIRYNSGFDLVSVLFLVSICMVFILAFKYYIRRKDILKVKNNENVI